MRPEAGPVRVAAERAFSGAGGRMSAGGAGISFCRASLGVNFGVSFGGVGVRVSDFRLRVERSEGWDPGFRCGEFFRLRAQSFEDWMAPGARHRGRSAPGCAKRVGPCAASVAR